jgi:hypothetical protein
MQYFFLNSAGVLKEMEDDDGGFEVVVVVDESNVGMEFIMPFLFGVWFNIAMMTINAMIPAIRLYSVIAMMTATRAPAAPYANDLSKPSSLKEKTG